MRKTGRGCRGVVFVLLIAFASVATRLDLYAEVANNPPNLPPSSQSNNQTEELQELLKDIQEFLEQIETELEANRDVSYLLEQLKEKEVELKDLDVNLKDQFNQTRKFLKSKKLPQNIIKRHDDFVQNYQAIIDTLLNNIDEVEKEKGKEKLKEKVRVVKDHLIQNIHKPKHRPLDPNNLPHRIKKHKSRMPRLSSSEAKVLDSRAFSFLNPIPDFLISSAYAQEPDPNLAETMEIQITDEIKAKAEQLQYNPVKIYEWVRNNVDYKPYYGSLQGSQMTLWSMQGNDFDQASLLMALFRASNIPCRYVYGTVEIPIEKAMNWVGIEDPKTCADLFASAGIPTSAIVSGGKISAIQIEHCWVEAYVDYIPSRGAIYKQGDTWIHLDPSFKQYEYTEGVDFATKVPFDAEAFINEVKSTATVNEAESYITNVDSVLIQQKIENYQAQLKEYLETTMPEATVDDVWGKKEIIKQAYDILPYLLPYPILAKLNLFSELPDSLRHKVKFITLNNWGETDINYTASMPELAGKRITLSYLAATPEDEAVIEEYGGIYNTLAYLITLKSVLSVENETKAVGQAYGLGLDQTFFREFITPQGTMDRVQNNIIVGNYYAIGLNLQKVPTALIQKRAEKLKTSLELLKAQDVERDRLVGELLYTTALAYFYQIDIYSSFTAKVQDISYIRESSEAITSLDLTVHYLFGFPNTVSFAGMSIDVDRDIIIPFSVTGSENEEKVRSFMTSMGTIKSALEYGIFEQLYNTPSISTVKAIQIANNQGILVYQIDGVNIDQILPNLQVSQEIKTDVQNAVNAGKVVTIPQKNIRYYDWEGTGYIVADPVTGEAAYLISGGLAGGGTADVLDVVKVQLGTFLEWAMKYAEAGSELAAKWAPILQLLDTALDVLNVAGDEELNAIAKFQKVVLLISAAAVMAAITIKVVTTFLLLPALLIVAIAYIIINFVIEVVFELIKASFIRRLRYGYT